MTSDLKAEAYLKVMEQIDVLMEKEGTIILGIDGYCGSGKTTLAKKLGEYYGCEVIAMDDFYLPSEMKTEERLSQLGGNVYYERVLKEVFQGIQGGEDFSYERYDCKCGMLLEPTLVKAQKLYIIEGSYSMHPVLYDYYDLRVFLTIGPEEQSERILKRNGKVIHKRFIEAWIPLENLYFEGLSIKEKCDLVLEI